MFLSIKTMNGGLVNWRGLSAAAIHGYNLTGFMMCRIQLEFLHRFTRNEVKFRPEPVSRYAHRVCPLMLIGMMAGRDFSSANVVNPVRDVGFSFSTSFLSHKLV